MEPENRPKGLRLSKNFIKEKAEEEVKPVESPRELSQAGSRAEQLRMWWKDRYRDPGNTPEKLPVSFCATSGALRVHLSNS